MAEALPDKWKGRVSEINGLWSIGPFLTPIRQIIFARLQKIQDINTSISTCQVEFQNHSFSSTLSQFLDYLLTS